ncbi:MAG TPA: sulfotransferase [Caulobacteraceae bacterium]
MSLKVIGAGLPRTATWSQKLALEQLGFGPCYHMSESLEQPTHWPLWEKAAQGEPIDWEAIFSEWGSTTDAPGCHFYTELAERYPEAKVVLSVRDPEKWFASTQNTILSGAVAGFHGARGSLAMVEAVGWGTDPRLRDKAWMLDRYHRHNEAVQRAIPAERLLVYKVSDGWEPLCRFLGVEAPETAYPQVNTTDDFKAMIAARVADGGGIAQTH